MSPTTEINDFVAKNTDPRLPSEQRYRDAVNILLARLRQAESEKTRLQRQLALAREFPEGV